MRKCSQLQAAMLFTNSAYKAYTYAMMSVLAGEDSGRTAKSHFACTISQQELVHNFTYFRHDVLHLGPRHKLIQACKHPVVFVIQKRCQHDRSIYRLTEPLKRADCNYRWYDVPAIA